MAVGLADGSTVEVTPEHPFWVDRGVNFAGPGWLRADELRVGDQLRTADGADATVVSVQYHTSKVEVYTLTLAQNHDFFVGRAQVLVHNAGCGEIVREFAGSNAYQAYRSAQADALAEIHLGSDAVPVHSIAGPVEGRVVGFESPNGQLGWRIDWDPNDPQKGFHINWWDYSSGPKRSSGWRYGANTIVGGTYADYLYYLARLSSAG